MSDASIRQGRVGDAAALAAFASRAFADALAAHNHPDDLEAHIDNNYTESRQAVELADPNVATLVAEREGKLQAYAQVRRNEPPPCVTQPDTVELHRFYVDRSAHGSGLASQLMQETMAAAREFQARHIWLSVWQNNPRAIAFYNKVHFVDVGSTVFMLGPDKQTDRVLVAPVN